MNWGYKITIGYLTFVAGIAFLVYKASSQKVDLVTSDYYEQELVYQKRINAKTNTVTLSSAVNVKYDEKSISIELPLEMKKKEVKANIFFYYPADSDRDFARSVASTNGSLNTPKPNGIKGHYILKLSWMVRSVHYYSEQNIYFK